MTLSASALFSWLMRHKTKRPIADSATSLTLWPCRTISGNASRGCLTDLIRQDPGGASEPRQGRSWTGSFTTSAQAASGIRSPKSMATTRLSRAPSSVGSKLGLFEVIWSVLLAECDQLGLVDWQWQAADGSMGKARNVGDQIGPNPADRAKQGSKKSLFVDGCRRSCKSA